MDNKCVFLLVVVGLGMLLMLSFWFQLKAYSIFKKEVER